MLTRLPLKALYAAICFLLVAASGFAQVTEAWINRYEGPRGWNTSPNITLDKEGNVYIAGQSQSTENSSAYATIKYAPSGQEMWVRRYDAGGDGFNIAEDITTDAKGNIYVTGSSERARNIPSGCATIKYDPNGNEVWVSRYDEADKVSYARKIVLDSKGNVYICGIIVAGPGDLNFLIIKYDEGGKQLWVRQYSGPGVGFDEAYGLAVDQQGNVYVSGPSYGLVSNFDFALVKYDPDGNELWAKRYNGTGNGSDWTVAAPVIDEAGNVYLTGTSAGVGYRNDIATIKYDAAGNELWVKRYSKSDNSIESATTITINPFTGHLLIAGESDGLLLLLQYDLQGNQIAAIQVNRPGGSLIIGPQGNLYVAGTVTKVIGSGEPSYDYLTTKLAPEGKVLWEKQYDGPAQSYDLQSGLAVDANDNVYVTGSSNGLDNKTAFATIKYAPLNPLVVNAGNDKTVYLGYGSNCTILTATASEGQLPYTYSWVPGGGNNSSITVCPTQTTTYTVTVMDANGNTATDQVTVAVIDVRCGNKNDKVLVCHNGKLICIDANSVGSHLNHGDKLGSCTTTLKGNSVMEAQHLALVPDDLPGPGLSITNTPNPFSNTTTIRYHLPYSGQVTIQVYNAWGKQVSSLVNTMQSAGSYQLNFSDHALAGGSYFYRITLTNGKKVQTATGKMMLVK